MGNVMLLLSHFWFCSVSPFPSLFLCLSLRSLPLQRQKGAAPALKALLTSTSLPPSFLSSPLLISPLFPRLSPLLLRSLSESIYCCVRSVGGYVYVVLTSLTRSPAFLQSLDPLSLTYTQTLTHTHTHTHTHTYTHRL